MNKARAQSTGGDSDCASFLGANKGRDFVPIRILVERHPRDVGKPAWAEKRMFGEGIRLIGGKR